MSMQDLLTQKAVERAYAALATVRNPAKQEFIRELGGSFSFRRMVEGLATGRLDGVELELLKEASRAAGEPVFNSHSVIIPLQMFRNLTVASPNGGGFLVSTDTAEPVDILRPWSVCARAGITVQTGLVGNQTVPRTSAKTTGYWVPDEATEITESQPTIGQIALTPKTGGAFTEFSRQLSIQANSEYFLKRDLLRTVGSLVDTAALNGTGASGQPTGLMNTPGIGTQSGSSLAHTGVTAMKQAVAAANAPDENIAFIGTTAVRKLLEDRERATGSGFIWDNDRVASRPAYVTTDLPAGTLACGAWNELFLGLWGGGLVFTVNPYAAGGFSKGIIQARVLVSCDVAVMHAAAFCVSTSIT